MPVEKKETPPQKAAKPTEPAALDAVLNVRLTCAEKAKLREDADLAALSLSELARRRYFGRPIIASADAAAVLAVLKTAIETLSHDWQKSR